MIGQVGRRKLPPYLSPYLLPYLPPYIVICAFGRSSASGSLEPSVLLPLPARGWHRCRHHRAATWISRLLRLGPPSTRPRRFADSGPASICSRSLLMVVPRATGAAAQAIAENLLRVAALAPAKPRQFHGESGR